MEIIGRLTADAKVSELKDGRRVVNFSIAINDSYKPKGTGERVQVTTYVRCAYWINPSIAAYLTKGTLVQLSGRISTDAWVNTEGQARATLRLHVSAVKFHGNPHRIATENTANPVPTGMGVTDDLPF